MTGTAGRSRQPDGAAPVDSSVPPRGAVPVDGAVPPGEAAGSGTDGTGPDTATRADSATRAVTPAASGAVPGTGQATGAAPERATGPETGTDTRSQGAPGAGRKSAQGGRSTRDADVDLREDAHVDIREEAREDAHETGPGHNAPSRDEDDGAAPRAFPGPGSARTADDSADAAGDGTGPDGPSTDEEDDDGAAWGPEDDRTEETLRLLRDKRRAHRGQRRRDLAVSGYVALLFAVGYGSTLGYRFVRDLEHLAAQDGVTEALRRALPAVLLLLACGLALLAARDALWRGPVLVSRPDLSWLLSQPLRRERMLRPVFRWTLGLLTAAGALCAVGGAVLLRLTGLAGLGEALALCAPAGVCLPPLAAALALQVERSGRAADRVRALTPYVLLAVALLAGQAAWAAAGHRSTVLETAELWSGPWGWAALPVVHAVTGQAPGWPVAVALLAVAASAAVLHADKAAGTVPTRRLRARAATVATVTSVLWSAELRAARLAVTEALAGGTTGARRRLRVPRSRRLAVVWRDALALLRAPERLVAAALWLGAGAGTAALAVALDGGTRLIVLAAALALGWLGVARLAETARLETDDLRRSSWSPFRLPTLLLMHVLVPVAAGVLLALAAAVPFALQGGGRALLLMPLCVPPFAAAAVLAAARGPVRTELLSLGLVTPAGDASVFVFLGWYAAPFVSAVGPLTAALGLGGVLDAGAPVSSLVRPVVVAAGVTAVLLFAVVRRAKALVRPAG
ncbi:hypothetical protein HMPREF1486_03937 [Streptomyces sp. HPH0547]|uniref:Uncharacterized protein n=1 Tax=Streptomyces albus TaxID=1888 RepID=A0A8H1LHX8_9ACTN|nr:hypothetical protein HMPREF1486_03937 [Streptomyces sp. HPH0547]TGG85507.1 hypothetical protein D8771_10030 [Streptomyces albus]GHJ25466.1 hypothetical protein TPA0909_70800 [Streptomyces albus]